MAKWKGKQEVLIISNMDPCNMVETTNKRDERKQKPSIARDYLIGQNNVRKSNENFFQQKIMSRRKIWINNKFCFLDNRFSFLSLYILQQLYENSCMKTVFKSVYISFERVSKMVKIWYKRCTNRQLKYNLQTPLLLFKGVFNLIQTRRYFG